MVIYVTSTVRVTVCRMYVCPMTRVPINHDGTMNKVTNHDQQLTVPRYLVNVSFFSCKCLAFIFTLEDIIVDFRSAVPKFVVNISNYVSKL